MQQDRWMKFRSQRSGSSFFMRPVTASVIVSLSLVSLDTICANSTKASPADIAEVQMNQDSGGGDLAIRLRSIGRYARTIELHRVIQPLNAEQLLAVIQDSLDVDPRQLRDEIEEVAIRRLAMVDPKKALAYVSGIPRYRRGNLIAVVFQEWSVADLDEAIEHSMGLDESGRRTAVEGIVRARYDLSERVLRDIALRLGHEDVVVDMIAASLIEIPIDNSQKAWQRFLIDHGANVALLSDIQDSLLARISIARFNDSGSEFLADIHSQLNDDTSRIRVLFRLLDSIVEDDPQYAFELAASYTELSPSIGGRAMDRVISLWARSDPMGALALSASINDVAVRARCEVAALKEWAKRDAQELLSFLDQVPPYLIVVARLEALRSLAQTSPESVINSIGEFESEADKELFVSEIALNWSKKDPKTTMQWLTTSPEVGKLDTRFLQRLHQKILADMVKRGEIQLALDVSSEQSKPVWQGWVIGEVAFHHGSSFAMELLEKSRDPIARQSAYDHIGEALVNEGKSSQAIELVDQEPLETQYQYYRHISAFWAENDPHDAFSKLDRLPSAEIKTQLAIMLAIKNTMHRALTSQQKEILIDIVPESFRDALD